MPARAIVEGSGTADAIWRPESNRAANPSSGLPFASVTDFSRTVFPKSELAKPAFVMLDADAVKYHTYPPNLGSKSIFLLTVAVKSSAVPATEMSYPGPFVLPNCSGEPTVL